MKRKRKEADEEQDEKQQKRAKTVTDCECAHATSGILSKYRWLHILDAEDETFCWTPDNRQDIAAATKEVVLACTPVGKQIGSKKKKTGKKWRITERGPWGFSPTTGHVRMTPKADDAPGVAFGIWSRDDPKRIRLGGCWFRMPMEEEQLCWLHGCIEIYKKQMRTAAQDSWMAMTLLPDLQNIVWDYTFSSRLEMDTTVFIGIQPPEHPGIQFEATLNLNPVWDEQTKEELIEMCRRRYLDICTRSLRFLIDGHLSTDCLFST